MGVSELQALAERPTLVWSPHPLQLARGRETVYAQFLPCETIEEYLGRVGLLARLGRQPFVLAINGRRVPRALWRGCRPKPGTLINLYAVVRGGGGGKNPLATVAMIALMVSAPGLGNLAAAQLGLGGASIFGVSAGALLGGAISVIGGMAINAIFPPPKPKLREVQQPGQESPTYSITGGSNQMRRYEPMPLIVGRHRVVPDYGAQPYTEFRGEDQYGLYVFDFGYNNVLLSEYAIGQNALTTYAGYSVEESDIADGVLAQFPANVDSIAGGALTLDPSTGQSAWVQQTSSDGATALAVDISGLVFAVDGSSGAIVNTGCNVGIEYRAVGSGTWLEFVDGSGGVVNIQNATRRLVRKTYKRAVASGQYEVRVRLHSVDSLANNFTFELSWSQLRTYQPDTGTYTGRKRLSLAIKASGQLNGNVEQFNVIASAQAPVWTGAAWVTQATSNPAWWFLEVARGKFVGATRVWGGGLDDARIDIDGLKLFGAWCDAQGLTINAVFDQQQSVYEILSAIALAGRATVSWATGKLGVVWDAPDQPVTAVFGMHNIIPGSFEIQYANEDLADVIEGEYINEDRDWQRDLVRVTVPGATGTTKVRRIQLFGRTSRVLAAEDTNLYAAQNAYRNRRYKFQTDWEGMPSSRGDVAQLSHDLASLDYSGRFIGGAGDDTTLVLSKAVPLYASGAFIVIVKPDGSHATYDVVGGAGSTDTLTLVDPLAFDPWNDPDGYRPEDYKWLYGPTATPGKKVKIEAFRPVSESLVEIHAIDELAIFYTAKNNPYTYIAPRTVFGTVPALSSLAVNEEGVRAGTGYVVRATVSWSVSGDYGFADVRASVNGDPYQIVAQNVRETEASLLVRDGDEVTFEVSAYGKLGRLRKAVTATVTKTIAFAASAPPRAITAFSLDGGVFRWPASTEEDVVGYRIKFHYGVNRSWADAGKLHEGLLTANAFEPPAMPAGLVTFMLKPVDAAGLESVEAAYIVKDLGDIAQDNVLLEFDFKALGWVGTLANGSVNGSDELEADATTLMWSPNGSQGMWSINGGTLMWAAASYKQMTYEDQVIVTSARAGTRMLVLVTAVADPYLIDYRNNSPDPMWAVDSDDALMFDTAEDDDLMWGPIPDWVTWPGSIVAEESIYEFRITTGAGATQGVVSQFTVALDVEDVVESFESLAIDAAGTRLALTKDYEVIKTITFGLESDGGTAVTVKHLDKDVTLGPLIQCFNAAGAGVAGTVDIDVRGY